MTLKITSKSLKHVIMHWHMSSTWPTYDLNVVFKYRHRAFLFVFVFITVFALLMVKKGFENISVFIVIHFANQRRFPVPAHPLDITE